MNTYNNKIKKKSWIKTILFFAKECRVKLVFSVVCAIISVGGGIIPYIGVYRIIVMFFNSNQTVNEILLWTGISIASYVIKLVFYGISTTLSHVSAYKILENIRLKIADRLMRAPLGKVLNQTIGKLKNVIVDRVETIELPLAHMIPEGISELLLPIGIFIYLIIIDWRMALASLVTLPIAAVSYGIMLKSYNKKYDDYMESSNQVNGVIVEYVEGIEVIKAFNQSAASYKKFENAVKSFREYTLDWFRSTWKHMTFGASVLPSTLLGTLPVGIALYLNGSLTPAELAICLILPLGMIASLTKFTVFVNDVKAIEYAVGDADEFLSMEKLKDTKEPIELHRYDIEMSNVSFSYHASAKSNTLENINFKLPQGSFSALVGPSGGGKSTVARLVARFWDVNCGEIKIGGVNITKLPLSQLCNTVSFVTQDTFLFNCSLMENIRLGDPQASDEEVIKAAKAACCDEFINALDNGYQTTAGEAGRKLSGGEKQRIAIARAILKNAPIVILDEATAFTDPENEDKIQKSIAALTRGKTLLVIAHRLSTIRNADQIIVMDKGRIVKAGTHQKLLEECGLYKKMWEAHIGAKQWAAGSMKGVVTW